MNSIKNFEIQEPITMDSFKNFEIEKPKTMKF